MAAAVHCTMNVFSRFVPVDCSTIIVKVANTRCNKYYCESCHDCYEELGHCRPYNDHILLPDLGNKEDCFTPVNWT